MGNTKLLVKAILERPEAYTWTVQGLGMMRMYLSDEVRLHVWDTSLIIPGVTKIHDHPWGFTSVVVAGMIQNQIYYEAAPDSRFPTEPFYKARLLCGAGASIETPVPQALMTGGTRTYTEGESYGQPRSEIHASVPADGSVTLITRHFGEDRDHANVFWHRGAEFVSAEPRGATDEEIGRVTKNALRQWFS